MQKNVGLMKQKGGCASMSMQNKEVCLDLVRVFRPCACGSTVAGRHGRCNAN